MPLRYGYHSAEAWSAARAAVTWSTVVRVSSSPTVVEGGSPFPPEGCSSFTDPVSSPGLVASPGEPQADSSTATDTRTGIQRFTSTSGPDAAIATPVGAGEPCRRSGHRRRPNRSIELVALEHPG